MRNYLFLISFCFLLFSCQQDDEVLPEEVPAVPSGQETVQGHIRVKLTEEAAASLSVCATRSGEVTTGLQELDALYSRLKTYRMQRTFRPAGKFEARHRAAGLHLWYDIWFDESVATRSVAADLKAVPGIDLVEEIPVPRIDYQPVPAYLQVINQLTLLAAEAKAQALATDSENEEPPFNDTRLAEQWHYRNPGTLTPSVQGADVNVWEAWKYETGSNEVIVAVIDEGVQYDHPDLINSMWVNTRELNGVENSDDDGNGFTDDIYGYNFVSDNGNVTSMTHGTHVAGTIAAENNNGLGVCGIAGGDGVNPGVRIMACQTMDGSDKGGNTPESFVYAADNGAVIAQCSWTYGYDQDIPSVTEAINYFIKNAGYAVSGAQTGPMAGGLVIFAAANDNTDRKAYPASLDQVVTVSAFAPDFTKASYSNYGDWVNIAAPGGETSLGSTYGILSTDKGSSYSWLQGTSMACPHVSGVAALILSKFKGLGYTADDLRERLLESVHDIDQYNPKYAGLLGVGYTDAALAVKPQGDPIPPATAGLRIVASFDSYTIVEWNVAADEDDGHASRYELEWEAVDAVAVKGGSKTYSLNFAQAGDLVRDTLRNLKMGVTYRYSLTGYDRWKNPSETSTQEAEVVRNFPPVLTAGWEGNAFVDENDVLRLNYHFSEPEGQQVSWKLSPEIAWMSTDTLNGVLTLSLAPAYGDYTQGVQEVALTMYDAFGASTTVRIPYQVKRKPVAPQLLQTIPDQKITTLYQEVRIPLADYFRELHGGELIFEVENSNSSVCFAQSNGTHLTLRAERAGYTTVMIRAINEEGLSAGCRFRIDVNPQ